jgi:hypothetical protein
MQSKEYFKNQARKLAKQTWAGPGKFGVFILLCIMIVATFESLGLSNREKNLEFRSVQKIVIPIYSMEKNIAELSETPESNSNLLNERIKISTQIDLDNKILGREKILLNGAMEQNIFENNQINDFKDLTTDQKIIKFYSELSNIKAVIDSNSNTNTDFFFDA